MTIRLGLLIAAGALLAGCATNPVDIAATPFADPALAAQGCDIIEPRIAATEAELLRLMKAQGERRARGGGELLAFGLTSNVFDQGTEEAMKAEIGRLKGARTALRAEAAAKGCNPPEPPRLLQRFDAKER